MNCLQCGRKIKSKQRKCRSCGFEWRIGKKGYIMVYQQNVHRYDDSLFEYSGWESIPVGCLLVVRSEKVC